MTFGPPMAPRQLSFWIKRLPPVTTLSTGGRLVDQVLDANEFLPEATLLTPAATLIGTGTDFTMKATAPPNAYVFS